MECVQNENAAAAPAAFPEDENSRELSRTDAGRIKTNAGCVNVNRLLAVRRRIGDLQSLARGRLSLRPDRLWWRKWAGFACNELLAAVSGDHVDRQTETHVADRPFESTTTTKTRTRRITWPKPCAATVLCYGRHRLFDARDQVPPAILAAVQAGVADALARGRRIRFTGEDIARGLGITAAEKLAAEAWQIGAVDVTAEEWAEIIRKRRAEQQRERRRKRGDQPHDDSIAAMARRLGVKPNSLRTKLRRARLKAEKGDAESVPFLKPRNKKKDREASRTGQRTADAQSRQRDGKKEKKKKTFEPRGPNIFSQRWKSRRPRPDASPTLSAAAEPALASTPLAEVCP